MGDNYTVDNAGNVTATSFSGDGSGLTSLPGDGGFWVLDSTISTANNGNNYTDLGTLTPADFYLVRAKISNNQIGEAGIRLRVNGLSTNIYSHLFADSVLSLSTGNTQISLATIENGEVSQLMFMIQANNGMNQKHVRGLAGCQNRSGSAIFIAGEIVTGSDITSIQMACQNNYNIDAEVYIPVNAVI